MTNELDVILRWIILPILLFGVTVTVAKNDYFGKGKWICVVGAALTFFTVPYTKFLFIHETESSTFIFKFPNFSYMVVGILISICGLGIGVLWNKMLTKRANIKQVSNKEKC